MITVDILCARFTALRPEDLQRWIAEGHVRGEAAQGTLCFREIDVERVRLILELRDELAVNEEALPVVLGLLDQVYALRRRLKQLGVAERDEEGAANPR
jgi:chaperone modulatory protein CbpM